MICFSHFMTTKKTNKINTFMLAFSPDDLAWRSSTLLTLAQSHLLAIRCRDYPNYRDGGRPYRFCLPSLVHAVLANLRQCCACEAFVTNEWGKKGGSSGFQDVTTSHTHTQQSHTSSQRRCLVLCVSLYSSAPCASSGGIVRCV